MLLFAYLLFFASHHYTGLLNLNIFTITTVLLTLAVGVLLVLGLRARTGVSLPIWLFMGALTLAMVFSLDPRRSLPEVWLILLAFFWLTLFAELTARGLPAELVVKCLLILGGILLLVSSLDFIRWYREWLQVNPGQWVPFIQYRLPSANLLAVLLNMVFVLALTRWFFTRSIFGRVVLALYLLLALFLIFLSSSRGGWIGLAFGLLVLAGASLLVARDWWQRAWTYLSNRKLLLAGLILTALAGASLVGWYFIQQDKLPTHASLFTSRDIFWPAALKAFTASPLLGQGPHTFGIAYLLHNSLPPDQFYGYAHNIYLDLLSGSGLLGLAAFLYLVYRVARIYLRRLRGPASPHLPVLLGALGAAAVVLAHGFFDSVHHNVPASAWILAILTGTALGSQAPLKKPSRAAVLPFLLLPLLAWLNIWALAPYQAGLAHAGKEDYARAAQDFELAARRDPYLALTHQQLGLARAVLAQDDPQTHLKPAIQAFERAAALDPYWALNHLNLGALYLQDGQTNAAIPRFEQAVQAARRCALCYLNLGLAYEASGQAQPASEAYARVMALYPQGATGSFWDTSALRAAARDAFLEERPPAPVWTLAELQAQQQASPHNAYPYLRLARWYLEDQQPALAAEMLNLAALTEDFQYTDLWLKAEIAAAQGDYAQAAAEGEWILELMTAPGAAMPGTFGKMEYAVVSLRRAVMLRELVPTVTALPLAGEWQARAAQLAAWKAQAGTP